MVATVASGEKAFSQRRAQLAGPSGIKGLIYNYRIFSVAVFASLGGFVYGYNQGMFGQVLNMTSFAQIVEPESISDPVVKALMTSILELGAWLGVLINGILADKLGRKLATVAGIVVFIIGVIVQACAQDRGYIYGGRFVTGLGVGVLSMIVPLYNAELSPAELRGSMVSLQQLAITFGIMVSYWIGYGTNFIGGTGASQSDAAWLIPICIQLAPALVLGVGILFMPASPRWLMQKGREDDCLAVIGRIRSSPTDSELVQMEFLEVKAQHRFEIETSMARFPQYHQPGFINELKLGFHEYLSLLNNRSLFKRVVVAVFTMVFQQWSGVNAILYYASFIFGDLGLGDNTSLLASGVGGIIMFVATIPAVLWIDQLGRKPILIVGALGMGISHFIVAGLYGSYGNSWPSHKAAGWVACAFVWVYEAHFGYSWGPGAWVVVSEIFPLGVRAKGISIGASSNWLNNFAVALTTPPMVDNINYGTFIFYGLMCVIGALFIYFVVPETRNLTLEEMDEVFGDEAGTGTQDRNRLLHIYMDLGLMERDPSHQVGTEEKLT